MSHNNPDKYAPLIVLAALVSVCVTLCIIATETKAAAPYPTTRQCADASEWGPAPDSVRPCVTLKGNAPEGGALTFKVADASGVVRYAGFINTPYRVIIHVRVVAIYEDGSFTWKARSRDGRTYTASVGNLRD